MLHPLCFGLLFLVSVRLFSKTLKHSRFDTHFPVPRVPHEMLEQCPVREVFSFRTNSFRAQRRESS